MSIYYMYTSSNSRSLPLFYAQLLEKILSNSNIPLLQENGLLKFLKKSKLLINDKNYRGTIEHNHLVSLCHINNHYNNYRETCSIEIDTLVAGIKTDKLQFEHVTSIDEVDLMCKIQVCYASASS